MEYFNSKFTGLFKQDVSRSIIKDLPPNLISTNVNTPSGSILLICSYTVSIASDLVSRLAEGREVYSFCPELSHLDVLGLKLTTMFRIGKVTDVVVLTKDGSPHSMQIPLMVQEAAENTNFDKSHITYHVLEGGKVYTISDATVRKARHYSEIEKIMPLAKLRKVVDLLRAPGGCPNDQAETWESVVDHLREETEEVAQAVKRNDIENLCDELGDLLFNIMLMSRIAEEQQFFSIESVMRNSAEKMIRGHKKVFANDRLLKF